MLCCQSDDAGHQQFTGERSGLCAQSVVTAVCWARSCRCCFERLFCLRMLVGQLLVSPVHKEFNFHVCQLRKLEVPWTVNRVTWCEHELLLCTLWLHHVTPRRVVVIL
jgi:hypothetical protein